LKDNRTNIKYSYWINKKTKNWCTRNSEMYCCSLWTTKSQNLHFISFGYV